MKIAQKRFYKKRVLCFTLGGTPESVPREEVGSVWGGAEERRQSWVKVTGQKAGHPFSSAV